MTHGLERRLKHELFSYCLLDSRFYENLEGYQSSETLYRDIVMDLLPEDWEIRSERLWHVCLPPHFSLPDQGFKIHLSAITATAITLLQRAIPTLRDAGVPFKIVADRAMLDHLNSKHYSRGSSGKFVTVYPRNQEECAALLGQLHAATKDMKGPHILSDRPFQGSKVVYYRYGRFTSQYQMTSYGDRVAVVIGPGGNVIPDARGPAFQLPEGISDPFQPQWTSGPSTTPPLLHARFRVESAATFANSGGIYVGLDTANERRVIIKEARPGTGARNDSPRDATDILAREFKILKALQPAGCVPEAIDYFQEWDHHFLVEEYVEGQRLANYRALEEVGLLVNRRGAVDLVSKFSERLRQITSNLILAVEACHAEGIVLGDLAPDNVIINEETLSIRLIDFEGASIVTSGDDPDHVRMATLGFVSPSRMRGAAISFADDWYSLAAVIYSLILPLQPFFHLHPAAQAQFLKEVVKDQGLPAEVPALIAALSEGDVARAKDILTRDFCFPELKDTMGELATRTALKEAVRGITDHILATKDVARKDRLFPSDYRIFSTNPLSVSYGAVGQALYIQSTNGVLPEDVRQWLLQDPLTLDNYAPGLYIGLSGVAWGLAELGCADAAKEAMNKAYESRLLLDSVDIFYGCAGIGLASLFFWHRTGDPTFLARACECGDHILQVATEDKDGYYWLNLDGGHHFGYAHGGSGIALFLLYLYRAKKDPRYLQYAIGGLDYEIAQGREEAGYVVWPRVKDGTVLSPYWRYGNAGIGSVLIRFYAILRTQKYLVLADKAARYAATKYAGIPGQFMGLSGMGEFLLDMYRFTGDIHYRDEARKIASGVLLFAVPEPQGIAFPGEELMRMTTDYATGSAGIGLFLSRLLQPRSRLFHDLHLDEYVLGHEGVIDEMEAQRQDLLCTR